MADLMGDALFICMDCLSNQTSFIDHNYSLHLERTISIGALNPRISRYTLEVSPAFGQQLGCFRHHESCQRYALCNGYPAEPSVRLYPRDT